MGKIIAYRQQYSFCEGGNARKYAAFVRGFIFKNKPEFYGVVSKKAIDTIDGPMWAIKISSNVEHPDYDPIAKCVINNIPIFLWNDKCWIIAQSQHKRQIYQTINDCHTMVIHEIGAKPEEQ